MNLHEPTQDDDLEVNVQITTASSRGFACTRAVLHAALASLSLAYSAVLWHVPDALYRLGSFGAYWGTEEEWDQMINVTRFLSQLGLVYLCFGYLEASCCQNTDKSPLLHRVGVCLVFEGLLAALWIDEFYIHADKMAALARYDNSWITYTLVITALSICTAWTISTAHLLVPFVHRLSLPDEMPVLTLLGRGVEDYPWPVEKARIRLIGDELEITFGVEEEVVDLDRTGPIITEEKGDLVSYDLV
ncbi:hypothetical protein HD553DRAFT_321392 [Filobasidium floriforme]|uniref:uncharacterized protein n=1 Tax=Filobasidium floriforme TaxID=5210 RepID=UPI001E8EB748|nr:uncharacterized protein HD553DRAFT_321392 [Filobasidium floriforme]KAH8090796.1 hypothetical protein HD553DRAFT_321392 [Filobasidium floriforme]